MQPHTAEVIICGAGIAGIAVAYELTVRRGLRDVVLVEAGDPLALTSDKSTEAYRNWWPDAAMVALMERSIEQIEAIAHASDNAILLNRRGYLYASADAAKLERFCAEAAHIAALGAGPLRIHSPGGNAPPYQPVSAHDFINQPDGADLILDHTLIRAHFPYLNPATLAVLHARRAGWFGGRQLGMYMLEQARAHGARLLRGRLEAIDQRSGRICGVSVATPGGPMQISAPNLVSAAGPLQSEVAAMLDLTLPLYNERHLKAAFNDQLGVVPREAPMLIWADAVRLPWEADERAALAEEPELRWLLEPLPAGVHARPEGGHGASTLLLLWDYHSGAVEPRFPVPLDPQLTELALRGMATMIPGLGAYIERVPQAYLDGGYYTRTRENRPLIGPLPPQGAYIIGALSGFGLMAACAAAELLGTYLTDDTLPSYAEAFALSRYADPAYLAALASRSADGQL
jgi:glycine/D-amino acid oxidase-like deaminating enzyme